MFENSQIRAKGHAKGLITDGKDYPENSVQDVLNLDLNLTWDERRTPYADKSGFDDTDIPTLSEKINSANYKILGICEKNLVDFQGVERDVVIVVLKHTVNFNIKIFANRFYNPTSDFGNNYSNSNLGWNDAWTELTEGFQLPDEVDNLLSVDTDPLIKEFTIEETVSNVNYLNKPAKYYKGWFIYDSLGVCVGQITDYLYPGPGTRGVFTVGINSILDTGVTVAYPIAEGMTKFYFTRFPLNYFAFDQINNTKIAITGISKANPMVISVAAGHSYIAGDIIKVTNVVGMTQVNNNTYTITAVGTTSLTIGSVNSTGYTTYVSGGYAYRITHTVENLFEDIEEIDFEETYNSVKICIGNGFRPVRITFLQNKIFWKADQIDDFKRSWDGFWMSYDIPKIDNIGTVVKFELTGALLDHLNNFYDSSILGKEIGLRLKADFSKDALLNTDLFKDSVVGSAITLDGYQTLFLKYFVGGKFQSGINYYVYNINVEFHFLVDFDRRITDSNVFGDSPDTTPTIASNEGYKELISFQLSPDNGGIQKTDTFTNVGTLNYYKSTLLFTISVAQTYAIGIALNSVLNSKYYHTPVSAFRFMFRIGNNIVGADLSADYLETSSRLKDNYGYSKIVISQIQYQGTDGTPVNADSCFGEERIRHLIQGERLTAGTGTIGNRFLLFTNKNLFYYDLDDEQKLRIRENFEKYLYKGTYGLKTVCKAQVGGQFAGVYWLANDSIYRFLDNQPEDILFNRWKETYQEMSESDKSAAVTGFNALTKDVYFKIGTKVYIWNILTEGWKIYSYYDVPECMFTANSGDLYFTKGQYIFKTEPYTTELRTDQSSAGPKSIPFYLRKRLTHGSQVINKIPDRVDMIFETESPEEGEDPLTLPADLIIQIGKHGSVTNILNKEFGGASTFKRSFLTALRVRANYYDVKLMSDPDTEENILRFKLHELIVNAKIGARDLTKI